MLTICRARRQATVHTLAAASAAAKGLHDLARTLRIVAHSYEREAEENEAEQAKTHDEEQRQKWIDERLQASNGKWERREERKTTSRARAAELDAAHRLAAARAEAYAAAHPPAVDRPATPADRPAGKAKRKPSPRKAQPFKMDVTAQALAEAPVRIATYSPSVFLEPAYAAYALAYFTRCARYDCPGRPEHADEGAAAAYLHLISRDYGKAGKQRGKATRNRISSHLHALRSAKYQARRRNWYAPADTNDTRSREKRQYCPGMGSQYQYGANPATIARTLETAERLAADHAEMATTRERRRHIWPDSGAKGRRPARLATAEVSLTEYAEAIRTGAE